LAGAPEEVIEKYKTFEYKNADLEPLLAKVSVDVSTRSKSRSLLYHAIQMARADDDYSTEEQKAVKKAAKLLKVEDDICTCSQQIGRDRRSSNCITQSATTD
jgi:uncharacterized tellurite resistance protein B-like protein